MALARGRGPRRFNHFAASRSVNFTRVAKLKNEHLKNYLVITTSNSWSLMRSRPQFPPFKAAPFRAASFLEGSYQFLSHV